ncbi:MAG: hypothetical protein V7K69_32030 [Nostoc sp.]|uniref:hypothetical protein n=1 Tax=Nostoc sp. TaxID=1180 RepID=UPI002FFCED15
MIFEQDSVRMYPSFLPNSQFPIYASKYGYATLREQESNRIPIFLKNITKTLIILIAIPAVGKANAFNSGTLVDRLP